MKFKSICITGVDGTGKSTIIGSLMEFLTVEKSVVQYMGLKNWETKSAQKCFDFSKPYIFRKFSKFILVHELKHRVYKYKKTDKIVIFDRYVDEQYLQFKKNKPTWKTRLIEKYYKRKLIDCFYKPTITIYLHCDLDISVSRKDDITSDKDIKRLELNKKIMDDYYLTNESVIAINTSEKTAKEVLDIIIQKMEAMECFNISMK